MSGNPLCEAVIQRMHDGRSLLEPVPCSRAELEAVKVHMMKLYGYVQLDMERRLLWCGASLIEEKT